MAMVPLGTNNPSIITLQQQLEELGDNYQALSELHASKTTALQNEIITLQENSAIKIKALEGAAKKKSAQVKTLEARLAKLESGQPPAYTMSSLTKLPDKKTH